MVYLENFRFPGIGSEEKELQKFSIPMKDGGKKGYGEDFHSRNVYPFKVMSGIGLHSLDFEPITILYGGNGSGKSTALNIISNKLQIPRTAPYNTTKWMKEYLRLCKYKTDLSWTGEEYDMTGKKQGKYNISEISKMITSDDIFKYMLEKRRQTEQKIFKSQALISQFMAVRHPQKKDYTPPQKMNLETGEGVDEYVEYNKMRKLSATKYLEEKIGKTEDGFSNGETALMYLFEQIAERGLYILDEPENSMSCEYQMKLAEYLSLVAMGGSQLIIATHSPFLLSIPNAKIYNLDAAPATLSKWNELENMKHYFNLFEKHRDEFL